MSLLRRPANNINQAQNANPPTPPNQPAATNSRFARPNNTANAAASNNNPFGAGQKQANNRANFSRFTGTPNRFGASDVTWIMTPIDEVFVRFDLNGLGDPFHRLLGEDLNVDFSDTRKLITAFEKGGELIETLIAQMEKAWASYKFKGAGLVYAWKDEIKQIIATQPMMQVNATPTNSTDETDDNSENADTPSENDSPEVACLRSIDMLLVLNVLARTRADLLLQESPISLERGFMERSLVTNEPMLVNLARATGCVEEHFTR